MALHATSTTNMKKDPTPQPGPFNRGHLEAFNAYAHSVGQPGNGMECWLLVTGETIGEAELLTEGNGELAACANAAAAWATGKTLEQITSAKPADILAALPDALPGREAGALLALSTLKAACAQYARRQQETKTSARQPGQDCSACDDASCTASKRLKDESDEEFEDRRRLQSRLCRIGHKIAVLSGKGGVGKSTVAVNIASALALSGKRVGLLDVDIHGPSVPTMLGLEEKIVEVTDKGVEPIVLGNLKLMSLGFLLPNQDEAVIWRGPIKMGVIKQFLKDVLWGDLDFLIIDSPPGTGDEPLSVIQLIGTLDGAVIVTTPQKVAAVDVRKSVTFCQHLHVPVLGVVENMSGFVCPQCGATTPILRAGGGRRIAQDMGVPFLGSIPMDPKVAEAADAGLAFVQHYASTPTAAIMQRIISPLAGL